MGTGTGTGPLGHLRWLSPCQRRCSWRRATTTAMLTHPSVWPSFGITSVPMSPCVPPLFPPQGPTAARGEKRGFRHIWDPAEMPAPSAVLVKHQQAEFLATGMHPEACGGRHPETLVICPFLRRESGSCRCPRPAAQRERSLYFGQFGMMTGGGSAARGG